MNRMFVLLLALVGLIHVAAECPNACSAHGRCGDYDSCECYRNWMSNDCSERVCQFGLAHVDTPKGDLDSSSGKLTSPGSTDGLSDANAATVVSGDEMYPTGTTEQYPAMRNSDSEILTNSAHYYMECSNKGICDRDAGECVCFDGYEGSACQRASCPSTKTGVCSGHGTCHSISALAEADSGNHYQLWDQDATMGCECDPGYTGADCSGRLCKYGFDPLYYDDEHTVRYSNWTFAILAYHVDTAPTTYGTFSIIFYDAHGEDWETAPINIDDVKNTADDDDVCNLLTTALEDIPNDVIPDNSVLCQATTGQIGKFDKDENDGSPGANTQWEPIEARVSGTLEFQFVTKFILAFPGNPGYLKQPEINIYLDGDRPSLYTNEDESSLQTWVFPNGFQGEDVDYVPDLCEDVRVSFSYDIDDRFYKLAFEEESMKNLFKTCLGDGDADPDTIANDIYQWDYGTVQNPHLIKLVDRTYRPASPLCPTETSKLVNYIHYKKGEDWREDLGNIPELGLGWCQRSSPPGFYAITFQDTGGDFMLFNRAGDDYPAYTYNMADGGNSELTVYFDVFTTTGTLQVISTALHGVTHFYDDDPLTAASVKAEYQTYHSNVLYTYFASSDSSGAYDISCEFSSALTNTYDSETQLACLEKGDLVFLADVMPLNGNWVGTKSGKDTTNNVDKWNAAGISVDNYVNVNPKYVNMYRVAKIGREYNYQDTITEINMLKRNKITFEQSLNFASLLDTDTDTDAATAWGTQRTVKIYKFTPPANAIQNTYAAECSTRGICNREDGVCGCFTGYTGDNCGMQNALAE